MARGTSPLRVRPARAEGRGAASLAASWSSFSANCRSRPWISGLEYPRIRPIGAIPESVPGSPIFKIRLFAGDFWGSRSIPGFEGAVGPGVPTARDGKISRQQRVFWSWRGQSRASSGEKDSDLRLRCGAESACPQLSGDRRIAAYNFLDLCSERPLRSIRSAIP